jgi:hypothetical protein
MRRTGRVQGEGLNRSALLGLVHSHKQKQQDFEIETLVYHG